MNSEEREAVLRARLGSLAMPRCWAALIGFDPWWSVNQEDGRRDAAGPVWRPGVEDVERMLNR